MFCKFNGCYLKNMMFIVLDFQNITFVFLIIFHLENMFVHLLKLESWFGRCVAFRAEEVALPFHFWKPGKPYGDVAECIKSPFKKFILKSLHKSFLVILSICLLFHHFNSSSQHCEWSILFLWLSVAHKYKWMNIRLCKIVRLSDCQIVSDCEMESNAGDRLSPLSELVIAAS